MHEGKIWQALGEFDKQSFSKYVFGLIDSVPAYIYLLCAFLSLLSVIILFTWKRFENRIKVATWLMLLGYVLIILCSTTIFRAYSESKPIELKPFWSYDSVLGGNTYLLYENIMNVLMFFPIGFLLGCLFSLSKWWATLLIGISLSVSIELLQLGFHRGLCELDDLIHNTTGCLIGLLIAMVVKAFFCFSKSRINSCCQVQQ